MAYIPKPPMPLEKKIAIGIGAVLIGAGLIVGVPYAKKNGAFHSAPAPGVVNTH